MVVMKVDFYDFSEKFRIQPSKVLKMTVVLSLSLFKKTVLLLPRSPPHQQDNSVWLKPFFTLAQKASSLLNVLENLLITPMCKRFLKTL